MTRAIVLLMHLPAYVCTKTHLLQFYGQFISFLSHPVRRDQPGNFPVFHYIFLRPNLLVKYTRLRTNNSHNAGSYPL